MQEALLLYQRLGDRVGEARTHQSFCIVTDWEGGHTSQCLRHAIRARELLAAAGDTIGQARALNNIGWTHAMLGADQQALECCGEALSLLRTLGDRTGEAATSHSLGYIHQHIGNHARAITYYERAIELHRQLGNRFPQARTFSDLGDTHENAGDAPAARDAWQQALAILDDLSHPDADNVRAKLTI